MPLIDPQYIVLATLLGSLVLFVTDALRYEVIAVLIVLLLASTGCLTQQEAFAGFSSPAVVLIGAMYVFGHAFTRWGVSEAISRRFLTAKGGGEAGLVLRIVLVSGLMSAVLSNTGVVATLIPVCSALARRYRIPISRLLMPMSFGTLLGGLVTVIATSKNIAVNEYIRSQTDIEPFGLFEFSHFGLILLAVGCLYFYGPGRALLPRSPLDQTLSERYQVPKFVTEVLVESSSTLINRAVADADLFAKYNVSVLGLVRAGGEGTVLAPGPYNRIRVDDTMILQGEPEDIVRLHKDLGLSQRPWVDTAERRLYADDVRLVEAVIPAGSRLAGRTLEGYEFNTRTALNVVALSKHGELLLQRMQHTPLEVGDTLLLQGHVKDIERARRERQLIVLDEVEQPKMGRGAAISVGLLLLVLLLATTTTLPLSVLALGGAVGLVLTGTVRAQEVPRVIDWSVLALIGGMLALGNAFTIYGLPERATDWLLSLGSLGLGPHALLIVLLVTTVLLTQVLNYITTAVIMTPIAIQLAQSLGVDSRPFLMAVIAGSEFAFLSPVAHQSNAMVLGPGGYRYKDFLKAGSVLTLIMVLISAVLIPYFWPMTAV
ncbi:MAG: SLC13 family permease [Planctomycetota bacterium]|nr:MAG: SLC13 family permease [Planctomycetota bacterium]